MDPADDAPRIELWRAPTIYDEGEFGADGRPMQIPRPTPPRFVREQGWPAGDALLIGRHVDNQQQVEVRHLPWTSTRDRDDDVQLSRSQLYLTRTGDRWTVAVPGPARSKRSATVQFWASASTRTLHAGGPGLTLDPSAYVGVVVHSAHAFYWALLITPPGPQEATRTAPWYAPPGQPGTLTYPDGDELVLPAGWKNAIQVKFEPYLRWPMGWRPAPVEPSRYVDPQPDLARSAPQMRASVRRMLSRVKEVAITNGYAARNPHGVEVELLEWLVGQGQLTFTDRHEWPDEPEPHAEAQG